MPRGSPARLTDVLEFLEASGARRLAHGPGRNLFDHLRATMKVLSHWRQPRDVVIAGALHSIYSTDVYHQSLIADSERKKVAAIAGPGAERLVYLFGSIRRNSLFQAFAKQDGWHSQGIPVECHRGSSRVHLSPEDAGKLLVIYMANTADQVHAPDHGPGVWLSSVSRWAGWARPLVRRVPPVFNACAARVSAENELSAGGNYRNGIAAMDTGAGSGTPEFRASAKSMPWIAEPRVLLSYAELLDGRWDEAFYYATCGLRRLDEWGTPWDKRLDFGEWKSIATCIKNCAELGFTEPQQAENLVRHLSTNSADNWLEHLKTMPGRAVDGAGRFPARSESTDSPALPARFLSYVSGFQTPGQAAKHNFYPGLGQSPVYPAKRFALARALEASYRAIRSEFEGLGQGDGFQDEIERIRRTGNWNVYMLYELGRRNDANCARCPVTASVVEQHAAVGSISSAVYFSVLNPQTHIAAHKGPTNMRLRCHLGIEVPRDCRMRVDTRTLTWREGRCLVFDDSFSHEVWNDSDRRRVVLVVDLWHPDLTASEIACLNGLQRYAYAHAKDMSGYWINNEKARAAWSHTPSPGQ